MSFRRVSVGRVVRANAALIWKKPSAFSETKYSKMQIRFLCRDGGRFLREVPEPLPEKYEIGRDEDPSADPNIQRLARAIFDKRLSSEATRIGEGNPQRVLDIMWSTTKPVEREAAMTEALALTVMMGSGKRTFKLHRARNGGSVFVELGTVFTDLTVADAPPAQLKLTKSSTPDVVDTSFVADNQKMMDSLKSCLRDEERSLRLSWRAKRADPEWWHKISEMADGLE